MDRRVNEAVNGAGATLACSQKNAVHNATYFTQVIIIIVLHLETKLWVNKMRRWLDSTEGGGSDSDRWCALTLKAHLDPNNINARCRACNIYRMCADSQGSPRSYNSNATRSRACSIQDVFSPNIACRYIHRYWQNKEHHSILYHCGITWPTLSSETEITGWAIRSAGLWRTHCQ